ncbi:helix-turn-helix domain-containing protein [Streptomyces sp. NPDC004596]|uniref:helix-turn-helix domain-containing protein n=1 Tax=Streptomyces sp. DSM 118148 TaxID=3448667 RepID=UPI0040401B48
MTDARRAVLEGWARRRTTAQAPARRSRIVLECADGHSIMEVSRRLRVSPDTVRTWRRRSPERGLDGLSDSLAGADKDCLEPPATAWTTPTMPCSCRMIPPRCGQS